jgi:hypothetical protein
VITHGTEPALLYSAEYLESHHCNELRSSFAQARCKECAVLSSDTR